MQTIPGSCNPANLFLPGIHNRMIHVQHVLSGLFAKPWKVYGMLLNICLIKEVRLFGLAKVIKVFSELDHVNLAEDHLYNMVCRYL